MKSFYPKSGEMKDTWYVVDLKDQVLGRAITRVANVLMGKNVPTFTRSVGPRHFVVVINSDHLKLTGKKMQDKVYYRHTGFPGGIKKISAEKQIAKDSTEIVKNAVHGMLPKSRLGRELLAKLKVYPGAEHPHLAQNPQELKVA
jgi:large subunit ribosomal protein L13